MYVFYKDAPTPVKQAAAKGKFKMAENDATVQSEQEAIVSERSSPKLEGDALTSKISELMKAARNDPIEAEIEAETEVPESDEPAESVSNDETEEVSESGGEEPAEAQDKTEVSESDSKIRIPDSHRRAMHAMMWDDAHIEHLYKQNPQSFAELSTSIYTKWKKYNDACAARGREIRDAEIAKPVAQPKADPFKEFRDKYSEDEGLLQVLDIVEKMQGQIQENYQQAEVHETSTLNRAISEFFASEAVEPYRDYYGGVKNITPEQGQHQKDLLELADALWRGYKEKGQILSFDDAMMTALSTATANLRVEKARETIKKEAKKRQAGITLKPSARKVSTPEDKKPKTAQEAAKAIAKDFYKTFPA